MPLLVDCYNVLHAEMPPSLAGLDEAGLCIALSRSRWAGQRVVVVCDGRVKPHGPAASPKEGVELVYSGPRCTADDVIIEMIGADSAPRRLAVVSNDRQIQKAARRRRCQVISCEEFIRGLAGDQASGGKKKAEAGASRRPSGPLTPGQVDFWLKEFGVSQGVTGGAKVVRVPKQADRRERRDGGKS
jgi:predicted RNA-binding protein with PIN domain